MRIIYISQYFPPEAGASQARAHELARNLVKLGHQVTMLAEFPNHPSGILPQKYHGRLYERDTLDGIEVIRVWVKASKVKNYQSRLLFYSSFMLTASMAGLFLAQGHYDAIYINSPPLLAGGAGLAISKLRRIPMVFEVCDLWPASATALGEMTNPRAIALATHLEEACYHHSRRIVVVTHGAWQNIANRGFPEKKLAYIPNGANTDLFRFSSDHRTRLRQSLGLNSKFIVAYAGLHGIAQGLETIVQTAHQLQENPDVHFIFIGEGPCKAELIYMAEQYHLHNITFIPEKPREEIPGYLSASDLALIPLKNIDLFKGVLPSKLFDAWACARPVLMSVDGEARQILEEVNGGIFSPPEDVQQMARAILWMMNHPQEREAMGANGRIYTVKNHSHPQLANKLADILLEVVQSH